MKKIIFAAFLLIFQFNNAFASPKCINDVVKAKSAYGNADLHKYFFHVYDASYWTDSNGWNMQQSSALHLKYFVDIDGEDFVERTVKELKNNPKADATMLAKFKQQLPPLMPNVVEGDTITAAYNATEQKLTFCHNNKVKGAINDKDMAEAFMGIWLGKYSSEPSMRKKLLRLQ